MLSLKASGSQLAVNEMKSPTRECLLQANWPPEKQFDGSTESRCGWLKDRYGLSRQVVPTILPKSCVSSAVDSQSDGRVDEDAPKVSLSYNLSPQNNRFLQLARLKARKHEDSRNSR